MSDFTNINSSLSSQISHYQRYNAEYKGFLNELAEETLSPEEQPIFLRAEKALKLLDPKSPDQKQLSQFLHDMLELHAFHLQRAAKNLDKYSISPLYLKRMERLDRLSPEKAPKVYEAIYEFVVSYCVNSGGVGTEKNGAVSANTSHFLIHPTLGKKASLFKPLSDKPSPFPGVNNAAVAQRQVGAYLLSRMHGSFVDVPLSTLSYRDEEIGSLQTFRKSSGELNALPPIDRFKLGAEEVQLAGVFRGRLYDGDGHLGNVLFKKREGKVELTHIDLDYILPCISTHENQPQIKMGWRFWPQMDKPFQPEVIKYLQTINPQEERKNLEGLPAPLTKESLDLLEATTAAFQIGAEIGLTPGEVVDYLDSTSFKSALAFAFESETPIEEFIGEAVLQGLKESKVNADHASRVISELTEKIQKNPKDEELIGNAVFQLENFVHEGPESWRNAVKLARECIFLGVSDKDVLNLIKPLQNYARSNPVVMYAAIESLADSLDVAGKVESAKVIREWLVMNLS